LDLLYREGEDLFIDKKKALKQGFYNFEYKWSGD